MQSFCCMLWQATPIMFQKALEEEKQKVKLSLDRIHTELLVPKVGTSEILNLLSVTNAQILVLCCRVPFTITT